MIIIQLAGGLGNQMFQYALYLQLKSLGKDVKIDDVSGFEQDRQRVPALATFGISYEKASTKEIEKMLDASMLPWHRVRRKLCGRKRKSYFEEDKLFHPDVLTWDDIYLEGYWQTEKYFRSVTEQVRSAYNIDRLLSYVRDRKNAQNPTVPGTFVMSLDAYLQEINSTESVSVHIRRGDYLDPANRAMFGGICTDIYYQTAIAFIKEKYPRAKFFLFSDDTEYVREKYQGDEYEIVDWNHGTESFYDMMLMSHCKHNICANSTFSFWGARLNRNEPKIMIRPSIHKNTQVCIPEQMKELWQGWILITPQGKII